jgi:hypothetical protein
MINGTKLLNVCQLSRGKRDGILKNEKDRVVVKVGAMHLKGVWCVVSFIYPRPIPSHIFRTPYDLGSHLLARSSSPTNIRSQTCSFHSLRRTFSHFSIIPKTMLAQLPSSLLPTTGARLKPSESLSDRPRYRRSFTVRIPLPPRGRTRPLNANMRICQTGLRLSRCTARISPIWSLVHKALEYQRGPCLGARPIFTIMRLGNYHSIMRRRLTGVTLCLQPILANFINPTIMPNRLSSSSSSSNTNSSSRHRPNTCTGKAVLSIRLRSFPPTRVVRRRSSRRQCIRASRRPKGKPIRQGFCTLRSIPSLPMLRHHHTLRNIIRGIRCSIPCTLRPNQTRFRLCYINSSSSINSISSGLDTQSSGRMMSTRTNPLADITTWGTGCLPR